MSSLFNVIIYYCLFGIITLLCLFNPVNLWIVDPGEFSSVPFGPPLIVTLKHTNEDLPFDTLLTFIIYIDDVEDLTYTPMLNTYSQGTKGKVTPYETDNSTFVRFRIETPLEMNNVQIKIADAKDIFKINTISKGKLTLIGDPATPTIKVSNNPPDLTTFTEESIIKVQCQTDFRGLPARNLSLKFDNAIEQDSTTNQEIIKNFGKNSQLIEKSYFINENSHQKLIVCEIGSTYATAQIDVEYRPKTVSFYKKENGQSNNISLSTDNNLIELNVLDQIICHSNANPPPTIRLLVVNGNDSIVDLVGSFLKVQNETYEEDVFVNVTCVATNYLGSSIAGYVAVVVRGRSYIAATPITGSIQFIVVGIVMGVLVVLLVFLCITIAYCRKKSKSNPSTRGDTRNSKEYQKPMDSTSVPLKSMRPPSPSPPPKVSLDDGNYATVVIDPIPSRGGGMGVNNPQPPMPPPKMKKEITPDYAEIIGVMEPDPLVNKSTPTKTTTIPMTTTNNYPPPPPLLSSSSSSPPQPPTTTTIVTSSPSSATPAPVPVPRKRSHTPTKVTGPFYAVPMTAPSSMPLDDRRQQYYYPNGEPIPTEV